MKKTYVTPEVEILALTETECYVPPKTPKEILSSTGAVIGYEEEEEEKTEKKSCYKKTKGWGWWPWWPWW